MDQPAHADDVLCEVIDQWVSDRRPPATVRLENVRGEWTAPLDEFLRHMAGPEGGSTIPRDYREGVEAITGEDVATYPGAAAALLRALNGG